MDVRGIVLLCFVQYSAGQVISLGGCPQVDVVQNFDINQVCWYIRYMSSDICWYLYLSNSMYIWVLVRLLDDSDTAIRALVCCLVCPEMFTLYEYLF